MWNPGFILIIVIAVVGMIVQARLQSVFKKYSQVMFPGGLTGREVAEKMLHDNGIYDVKVTATQGHLTDHYNPATKTVNLSESVYNSNSVSAAAVAAHECGHNRISCCKWLLKVRTGTDAQTAGNTSAGCSEDVLRIRSVTSPGSISR